jgi:regulatory protein
MEEVFRGTPDDGQPQPSREQRFDHALAIALRYLNHRDRTVHEMRGRLERAAIEESLAGEVIETLIAQHLLDDHRFAQLFTQDKRTLERWGNDRIERALRARGIDAEVAREALAGRAPESELERALELLRHRFPAPPTDRRGRDRALGVLLRKGYDSEVALEALAAHARGAEAA